MFIYFASFGPFATNAYIIACEKTREAVIIDPAPGSFTTLVSVLEENQLIPKKIWLTHSHVDHIADVSKVIEKYPIPVFIHKRDQYNLEDPGSDGFPTFGLLKAVKASGNFKEGDTLTIGDISFNVIETPGHTPGGVCFYSEKEKALISGDTLFKGSIGNLSLPTSNPAEMWPSLDKLAKLPADTKVYPGHGKPTTIGNESWLPNARAHFDN